MFFLQVVFKGYLSGKVVVYQCCVGDMWYIMLEEDEMKKRFGEKIFVVFYSDIDIWLWKVEFLFFQCII